MVEPSKDLFDWEEENREDRPPEHNGGDSGEEYRDDGGCGLVPACDRRAIWDGIGSWGCGGLVFGFGRVCGGSGRLAQYLIGGFQSLAAGWR
jgi:hypothetical protein